MLTGRLRCRGCAGTAPVRVLDLGEQPASDSFPGPCDPVPDPRWPLELWWCPECTLAQLGPVSGPVAEPVLAVESDTSRRHAAHVVAALLTAYPSLRGRSVREFASHHGGSWLPALQQAGCGPAAAGRAAELVVDTHALAHEEDVQTRLAERAEALASDGLLVLEFHHLLSLVDEGQFDTVRHGHWSYLSLTALTRLAGACDLTAVDAVAEPVFGGSLRAVFAPARHVESGATVVQDSVARVLAAEATAGLTDGSGLVDLGLRARDSAAALHTWLQEQSAAGRSVVGYGAPSKAAVLLGFAGVGTDLVPFTVDAAPLKHGRYVPGVRIPIRPVEDLRAARPAVVLLLAWDLAAEVIDQLESAGGWGAQYILPMPTPTLLPTPSTVAPAVQVAR